MPLNYLNLDARTRAYMVEEIDSDTAANKIYPSHRLTPAGLAVFPTLLKQAATNGTDATLAAELAVIGRLNTMEARKTGMAKVPVNAHETLAEGEFNRFYARGLCRRAIDEGIDSLVIYRARPSSNPRPESEAKIGTSLDPKVFLEDLRNSIGIEPALGLPQPNSGLSVKLP